MSDVWVDIDYSRDRKQFEFVCGACGWEGDTKNLPRAAAGIGEHLRACDGTPPSRRDAHYRPESHPDARVSHLPKYPENEGN